MTISPLPRPGALVTPAGPQSLHYQQLSTGQRPWFSTTIFTSLVKIKTLYVITLKNVHNYYLLFAGNHVNQKVSSDVDNANVYDWNGDEEEWTVHGTIMQRKSRVGVSLVPLSSGVLDNCTTT